MLFIYRVRWWFSLLLVFFQTLTNSLSLILVSVEKVTTNEVLFHSTLIASYFVFSLTFLPIGHVLLFKHAVSHINEREQNMNNLTCKGGTTNCKTLSLKGYRYKHGISVEESSWILDWMLPNNLNILVRYHTECYSLFSCMDLFHLHLKGTVNYFSKHFLMYRCE